MENDKNIMDVQKRLFHEIKKNLPPRYVLVDVISEVLNIGLDAAYNRIRCDKLLNIKEAYILCKHFRIPFDLSSGVKNMHQFDCSYRPVDVSISGEYLNYILALSKNIEKLGTVGNSTITLSATDIPVFHLISQKELILFKLYTWAHSVYNYKGCLEDFMKETGIPEVVDCYQKISKDYEFVPSTEIWTDSTVDTTLKIINYYLDICMFSNKDFPLLLCRQVLNILDKLQKWTENSSKGDHKTSFQLYVSEMELENTYILMEQSGTTNCIVKLFSINTLLVFDKEFCEETKHWLTKLAKRSISLCGGSEKERIKFFRAQREKVRALQHKIENSFR